MKKIFLAWLAVVFILIIAGSIDAVVKDINPLNSKFYIPITSWTGLGLLAFGIVFFIKKIK